MEYFFDLEKFITLHEIEKILYNKKNNSIVTNKRNHKLKRKMFEIFHKTFDQDLTIYFKRLNLFYNRRYVTFKNLLIFQRANRCP